MEPCSILELSNTVLKLSWGLYQFFKAIRDAPEEIHGYLGVLENIRRVLQDVKVYAEDHWRSSFFGHDGMRLTLVEALLRDCELEFAIQLSYVEDLDPATGPSLFSSTGRKIKWVLKKETLEGLTKKLEKLQSLLIAAVTTSTGRNDIFMREQLESISLDVRKIDAAKEAEIAERETFIANLQQLTTVFQKRTSAFIQLAADLHIRSDTHLTDLSESLTKEFGTKGQPEVRTSEHAASVPFLEIRADNESQNKGLAKDNEGWALSIRQEADNSYSGDPSDEEAFRQNNNSTDVDFGIRKTPHTAQVNDEKKLGALEVFNDAVLEYSKVYPHEFLEVASPRNAQAIQALNRQMEEPMRKRFANISSGIFGSSKFLDFGAQHSPAFIGVVWGTMQLLVNLRTKSDRNILEAVLEGLQEMSDAVRLCERELLLYQDPEIFCLVKECYISLLQLLANFRMAISKRSPAKIQGPLWQKQELSMSRIRSLSLSVQREADYRHRREMREASDRLKEMQVEQRTILMAVEDQKRLLQGLQEERSIMNIVQEQQKIMQVVQDIQKRLQE